MLCFQRSLSVTFSLFFVCESNISETAERICAKFTEKMYLVPCSDDLNVKVKGQDYEGQRTHFALPCNPGSDGMERARCK